MSEIKNNRATDQVRGEIFAAAAILTPVFAALGGLIAIALSWAEIFGATTTAVASAILTSLFVGVPLLGLLAMKRAELTALEHQLHSALAVDRLTSTLHGSVLVRLIDAVQADWAGEMQSGAFLIVDADQLRDINRGFGHQWGDEALRVIADGIRKSIRKGDMVGRIAGEEFGVYLPYTSLEDAQKVAHRIQEVLANIIFEPGGSRCPLTVTVGGVAFRDKLMFDELHNEATEQLVDAKMAGQGAISLAELKRGHDRSEVVRH